MKQEKIVTYVLHDMTDPKNPIFMAVVKIIPFSPRQGYLKAKEIAFSLAGHPQISAMIMGSHSKELAALEESQVGNWEEV